MSFESRQRYSCETLTPELPEACTGLLCAQHTERGWTPTKRIYQDDVWNVPNCQTFKIDIQRQPDNLHGVALHGVQNNNETDWPKRSQSHLGSLWNETALQGTHHRNALQDIHKHQKVTAERTTGICAGCL
jgi:hypothetical protein